MREKEREGEREKGPVSRNHDCPAIHHDLASPTRECRPSSSIKPMRYLILMPPMPELDESMYD
jgi:hypothetical protein